jgi:cytochrome b
MDQNTYRDALLAQNSTSVAGLAFRLAEMVEALKGHGHQSVAHNPAVRALIYRLAWLTGMTEAEGYFDALDQCLGELNHDEQQAVLEAMQTDAAERLVRLG